MNIDHQAKDSLQKIEVAGIPFIYPERTEENLLDESALLKLFNTYKSNSNIEQVLIKVATLNALYNAGVPNSELNKMANRIVALAKEHNLDALINDGNMKAVCLIGNCKNTCRSKSCASNKCSNDYIVKDLKQYISFASKYCSFQERANNIDKDSFPMYDALSRKTLKVVKREHQRQGKDANHKLKCKFTGLDTKYCYFKCVIDTLFSPPYYLDEPLTYTKIDDFLWRYEKVQAGKKMQMTQ